MNDELANLENSWINFFNTRDSKDSFCRRSKDLEVSHLRLFRAIFAYGRHPDQLNQFLEKLPSKCGSYGANCSALSNSAVINKPLRDMKELKGGPPSQQEQLFTVGKGRPEPVSEAALMTPPDAPLKRQFKNYIRGTFYNKLGSRHQCVGPSDDPTMCRMPKVEFSQTGQINMQKATWHRIMCDVPNMMQNSP